MIFIALLVAAFFLAVWAAAQVWKEETFNSTQTRGSRAAKYGFATFGVCAGVLFIAACSATSIAAPKETRYFDIYSMGDGLGVEGHFFLGMGSVDSEPVFMYYTKDENGYFELRHMDAGRVRIVEYDSGYPHYEKQCKNADKVNKWIKFPVILGGIDCGNSQSKVTFFVPKGSVKQNFNLDAS